MDEPAAGLPEAEVPALRRAVRAVRDDAAPACCSIDHNIALIIDVCERDPRPRPGTTLAEGTPAEIRAQPRVAAAYLGESAAAEEPRVTALAVERSRSATAPVDAVRGLSLEVEPARSSA